MKNKYRNIFLGFGIIAVVIMLFTFDMSYEELWSSLKRAGYYLPLVLLLWLFIYLINTLSWYIIIRSGGERGGDRKSTRLNSSHPSSSRMPSSA